MIRRNASCERVLFTIYIELNAIYIFVFIPVSFVSGGPGTSSGV